MLIHGWSWKVTADTCSNPATHHPVSVVEGNSTSISAMVQVDDNLELNEEAFRFLINQIKDDLPGMSLPRYRYFTVSNLALRSLLLPQAIAELSRLVGPPGQRSPGSFRGF